VKTPKKLSKEKIERKQTTQMKRNLLTFAAAAAIAIGGFALAQAEEGAGDCGGRHGGGHRGNPLERMSETLNLTPEQKAKVQPILDQAKPQIIAIHKDAMEKMKAVMENTTSQIRPLLNPDQQQKLDDIKKAHQDLHNARKELQDAKKS
jgi:Spy/CpxP family protein refolding chaperone